jgi:hypothetical protein
LSGSFPNNITESKTQKAQRINGAPFSLSSKEQTVFEHHAESRLKPLKKPSSRCQVQQATMVDPSSTHANKRRVHFALLYRYLS